MLISCLIAKEGSSFIWLAKTAAQGGTPPLHCGSYYLSVLTSHTTIAEATSITWEKAALALPHVHRVFIFPRRKALLSQLTQGIVRKIGHIGPRLNDTPQ
jgi:hypothetical protein